jgi:hypothetical protein
MKDDVYTEIARLDERITALNNMTSLTFLYHEKALELRSKELDRRLEFLNGEADRLRLMQATYVPRETFDAETKGKVSWGVAIIMTFLSSLSLALLVLLITHMLK